MIRARSKSLACLITAVTLATLALSSEVTAAKKCYDCHKQQKQEYTSRKFIHDPVKAEQCESCHLRHGFAQQLVLKANDNQLCFSCHSDLQEKFSSGVVHFPVNQGLCWDCHNPHAADKKGLLLQGEEGAEDPAACLICHSEDMAPALAAAYPHKPFNDLNCLACHEAHNSQYAGLLKQEGGTLCLSCHQGDAQTMAAAHEGKHTEALSCLDCHSGHGSSLKGLLSEKTHSPFADGNCETCHSAPDQSGKVVFAEGATPNSVCADCHDDKAQSENMAVPHPAVSSDNCSDCHKPHSSTEAKLLVKAQGQICQDCHTDVITVSELVKHQPAALGECSACHETHGSQQAHLLKKTGADLCLGCHTDISTARDSSVSVHAATDDCLSCHSPHEGVGTAILRKAPEQLCADCHEPESKALTAASSHQPYVTGNCGGCHQPHFSASRALLRAEGPKLCTSCHVQIGTRLELTYKHSPATDDCLSCHQGHYSGNRNLLTEEPRLLCLACHDAGDLGLSETHVHTPGREGDCTGCHDPHGSERVALISGRTVSTLVSGQVITVQPQLTDERSSLCYTCHQEFGDKIQKSAAHKPVKDGNCDACHAAHGSGEPGFVKALAPELCAQCHAVDSTLDISHQGYNVAMSNCLDCHNPHLSTSPKLVRSVSHQPFAEGSCDNCHEKGPDGAVVPAENMTEVCAVCHDNLPDEMKLSSLHPPFESGDCQGCHGVHAADRAKLLKAETDQLCFDCHDDLRKLDTLAVVHRPFGDKKCLDCHKPHSSAHAGLLNAGPKDFCLECHAAVKKSLEQGQVHAPVKSGECSACHEVHASAHKALLVTDKKALCGKCHNLTSPAITAAHGGFDISDADCQGCHAAHVGQKGSKGLLLPKNHKPFAQGQCTSCHESVTSKQLVAAGVNLCAKCHTEAMTLMNQPVVHSVLKGDTACSACHGPHVGFGTGLQRKEGVSQCLSCHNTREFTGPVQHQPAFDDCGTCHDPHSSKYKNLLSTSDLMQVCLDCHENAPKTHYHKMGKGVVDPRTKTELVCTGCHSPHSSTEKTLLVADKNRKLCNLCHGTAHE